jgi:hypothetical protein
MIAKADVNTIMGDPSILPALSLGKGVEARGTSVETEA